MGKNILVAHGGGPTAVINCSLQGVVEAARASGKVDKIYAARLSGQTAVQNVSLMPLKDSLGASEELFVIPPHTLYGNYPPKIAESEIKSTQETGNIVLSRVVIPAGVCLPQPSYTSCIPFQVTAACAVNFPGFIIYRRPVYFLAVQPVCCFP